MLLNSVIILIREVLEAVLLFSILMSMTINTGLRRDWLFWSIPLGLLSAVVYASQLRRIADWFDGVGQEVFNALSQGLICLLLPMCMLGFIRRFFSPNENSGLVQIMIMAITVLAILREGAEIYLYLSAFLGVPEWRSSLYMGSTIGVGLGLSVGVLFYFWLRSFRARTALLLTCGLTSVVVAGMALQACKMLIQADWLPDGRVWDSSGWLPEDSVPGQLLYALAGYEATPAPVQVATYVVVLICSLSVQYGGYWMLRKRRDHAQAPA